MGGDWLSVQRVEPEIKARKSEVCVCVCVDTSGVCFSGICLWQGMSESEAGEKDRG